MTASRHLMMFLLVRYCYTAALSASLRRLSPNSCCDFDGGVGDNTRRSYAIFEQGARNVPTVGAHARSLMSEICGVSMHTIDTYAASSGIPTVRTQHAGNVNHAARRDR
jgi:hypothetical protein